MKFNINNYNPVIKNSENYYFSPDLGVIYAPVSGTFAFFHELSHYIDHQSPIYARISIFFDSYRQICVFSFPVLIWLNLSLWLIMFSLYAVFIIQEELRAYINAYNWSNKKYTIRW